ncbi:MAG: (2Fe-2S)-binding protein [Rhodanobacter sp.]|nr:MAG: (2Fe-2S)-binding protein [Rhodanobacter sp.]TAM09916.1 MAG: (2Fe-2S)-binding protein [Rhodanobacter sp.]TAM34266.1 MAG: (2Fe-2S)-binding protein [Rhodanobacter sp.]
MRCMYICMCNAVTDRDIRRAVAEGVRTFAELQQRTRCSTTCGCCMGEARACFKEALHAEEARADARPIGLPVFAAA